MTLPVAPLSILDGLSEEERRTVLAAARRRKFKRGEVVFHEGDPGDAIHVVEKGHVVVRVSTVLGDVATLTVLGPGDSFGEGALLSPDARRTASVVAVEGAETRAIPRSTFEELRTTYPGLERMLTTALAAQVRRLSSHLVEALYVPAEQRVLRRLLFAASSYGDVGEGPVTVPLTQEDLATMAGTTRPTANRMLKAAEDEGWLSLARGRIVVLDAAAIAHRAR